MVGGKRRNGRRRLLIGSALALVVLGVAGYLATSWHGRNGGERSAAPGFTLTAIDGAPVSLEALRGKVVLIDFFATWCGPCRDEIPDLVKLQREYGPRGVQLLGISMDDDAAPVKAFYAKHQMDYPVAVADAALGERYGGVLGLPVKFLIDRKGRIAFKHEGKVDPAVLKRELDQLLAE